MDEKTITDWIIAMRQGDPDAVRRLWDRFVGRVRSLARSKLSEGVRRLKDEDDVAQSALHALWTGAQKGRLDRLEGRDELWRLLAVITCRKAANAARGTRFAERGDSALDAAAGLPVTMDWIGSEHDSSFVSSLDAGCRELLDRLDPWLRRIVILRLEGHSNAEIAELEQRSVKTIERYMKMARQRWGANAGE